jgi:hypothetical protein
MTVIQFPRKFDGAGERWDPWLSKVQVAALLKRTPRWVEMQHSADDPIPSRVGRGGRREYPYDRVIAWWAERQESRTSA